jgi:diguanylate cyclase (GGDEF)-like protein
MSGKALARPYRWAVVAAGALIVLWGVNRISPASLDLRLLLLAAATVTVSSRLALKIPRRDNRITLSDALIFLAILIYGGEAGAFLYVFLSAMTVIWFVQFTYDKHLENVKAKAARAELSERERARLAERNVEEQRKYIEELERIRTELEESREHFRHAAFHDALTGLPNRALLTDHLKLSIGRARRRPEHLFAVLFLDLDRFKNINDSLGHAAGDQFLVEIAWRLQGCLRPSDAVARLGGDEFAILLDGLDANEDAVRVAERVQDELARPFRLDGHDVYTTASIGITLCTSYYDSPEKILRDADTAMYQAKEKGKARYELFDATMHANVVARLHLENDLRRAVDQQEFQVYYQPIIALDTGRIAGFEALVRWCHPERGVVSPAEFIPLAEETGLIMELGEWVLRESCRQMRRWTLDVQTLHPLMISVNLSTRQFAQPDLVDRIKKILRETGLDQRQLKLEITESAVMENAESAASMLVELRELGVKLSIDDFGTGYSSLAYLHRFPVDTLKIDRSFISRMNDGDENAEIVRTVVTLATNLGMAVVAEGVETDEQHECLRELKCEYAQGYLFSRPVDAETALALMLVNQQEPYLPPNRCAAPEPYRAAV